MAQIDFLPVATGTGANIDTQANFAGSGYQQTGFKSGISLSRQFNKVWRQSSFVISCIAQFISQALGGINVLDDGNQPEFIGNFIAAIQATATASVNPALVIVGYSATPTFNCNLGNLLVCVFSIILQGNVSSSSIINGTPGQIISLTVQQDSVGGRTFVPPTNLPMGGIGTAVNSRATQLFLCISTAGGGAFIPLGSITIS